MRATTNEPAGVLLSDRWSEPLEEDLDPSCQEAVAQLGGLLGASEMAFVARRADGEFGIVVEEEFLWPASDDDEAVIDTWGHRVTNDEALVRVEAYAAVVECRMAEQGLAGSVTVVAGGDSIWKGRLALPGLRPRRPGQR